MNRFINKLSLFKALNSSGNRLLYRVFASAIALILLSLPASAFDESDRFLAVPSNGTAPLTVVFDAETVEGGLPLVLTFVKWYFGDGTVESRPVSGVIPDRKTTIEHTYVEPGIYQPIFEFTDGSGNVRRIFSEVEVLPPQEDLSVTITPRFFQEPVFTPFIFETAVTGGEAPYVYTHDFGDASGQVTGFFEKVQHEYESPGTYDVTVKATDRYGNQGIAATKVTVAPRALEFESAAAPKRGIAPLEVTFSVFRVRGLSPFTYTYDFGDNTPPSAETAPFVVHRYTEPGTYEAVIEVTDALGNMGKATLVIEVVTQAGVVDRVDELENEQLPEITDLENLDEVMAPIIGRFTSLLDDVEELDADDPLKVSASNTAVETAERLFAQQLTAIVPFMNSGTPKDEVAGILDNAGLMARSMVSGEIPLPAGMVDDTRAIADLAFRSVLDDILEPTGVATEKIEELANDPEKAKVFLGSMENKKTLGEILTSVSVRVGAVNRVTREEVEQVLAEKGIADSALDAVKNSLPEVADMKKGILQVEGGETRTLLDFVQAALPGESTVTPLGNAVKTLSPADELFSQAVTEVRIVPDHLPEGIFLLPDGTKLAVKDNVAISFSPAPADAASLASEISELGFTPEFLSDGRLVLTDPSGDSQLVFNMGWRIEDLNRFLAGAVSFSISGSDPASEAYAVLITYEEGQSQNAVPMIMAKDRLIEILDSYTPGLYSLDLETGVLDLTAAGSVRFKADWVFENLSSIDFNAIQNAGGAVIGDAAFEISDYNNDGVTDVRFTSSDPMGRQILYGLAD